MKLITMAVLLWIISGGPLFAASEGKRFQVIYQADIMNVEIDPDSTLAHISTYSFRVLDPKTKIEKILIDVWEIEGSKDRWEKVQGLKFGDEIQIIVTPETDEVKESLEREDPVILISDEEFEIVKPTKVEQVAAGNVR